MVTQYREFEFDRERFDKVNKTIYNALIDKKGIFSLDYKNFIPQWNIPQEFEHNPTQTQPFKQLEASQYLWTCSFFERSNLSRVIMRNALKTWNQKQKQWFFDPKKVAESNLEKIAEIIKEDMQFKLNGKTETPNEVKFHNNAKKLSKEYNSDPRKIIQGKTVEQARQKLMQFQSIGTGIANLYMMYLFERELALPNNPEELMLKVDVHKARIPINTGAVTPINSTIRYDKLVNVLEQEYKKSARRLGLDLHLLDSALWIIGSQSCVSQDYNICTSRCPLSDKLCISNVGLTKDVSTYLVYKNGKRTERRKNIGQLTLGI